jgi:hypothetical protein
MTRDAFLQRLSATKKKVLKLSDKQLDALIEDSRRRDAYNTYEWLEAIVRTDEIGVWRRAGGLRLEWTNRSLKETAEHVKRALSKKAPMKGTRARRVIPNMLHTNIVDLQKEKYLLPIVFKGNTGTRGRRRLKYQTKGDIDDGCMRSVALAVSGKKTIKVYFGTPRK